MEEEKYPTTPKETSRMRDTNPTEALLHPTLGKLPARKVLECIFALSPEGPYVHYHLEEVTVTEDTDGIVYSLNGRPPAAGRERCRIIPPLVNQFDRFESVASAPREL